MEKTGMCEMPKESNSRLILGAEARVRPKAGRLCRGSGSWLTGKAEPGVRLAG